MKIRMLCVGKLKEKYLSDACDEYIKRLSAFCDLEILELAESKIPTVSQALAAEGEAISRHLTGYITALCVEGESISSENLAEKIQKLSVDGNSSFTFIIGSSHGISDNIKQKAHFKLSMSKLTFPHQLARVILLEQIYRIFQINFGGKYHK